MISSLDLNSKIDAAADSDEFLPSILGTDSNKILEEYALRFGVPDSYRQISFFHLLVS